MKGLNSRVVLTYSKMEGKGNETWFNITSDHGLYIEEQSIGVVYHEDEQAAESIANHIICIPQMVVAIEAYNKLKNAGILEPSEFETMSTDLQEKMKAAYTKLYGE